MGRGPGTGKRATFIIVVWAMQGPPSAHARSDSFGEFQVADEPLELGTTQDDPILDLRPIEQKLDAHRNEKIAEAIATEQAGPSTSPQALEDKNTEQKHTKASSYTSAIWSKLSALSAFHDAVSKPHPPRRRPSVIRRQTSSTPISGAPGFDPNASPHWNRGNWTLSSSELSHERQPIPVTLRDRNHDTDVVIEPWHAARIQALLPLRLRLGKSWSLLYSLDQHGSSLATLYSRVGSFAGLTSSSDGTQSEGWLRGSSSAAQSAVLGTSVSDESPAPGVSSEVAMVLAVSDTDGNVFGAFINEPLHKSPHYYGNGQCFLWKTVKRRFPAPPAETDGDASNYDDMHPDRAIEYFCWSGENDYMVLSESDYLSVGGGNGRYGLWLDDTFSNGLSSRCPAFNNEVLCNAIESQATNAADTAPKLPVDLLIPLDEPHNASPPPETSRFTCIGVEVWAVGLD